MKPTRKKRVIFMEEIMMEMYFTIKTVALIIGLIMMFVTIIYEMWKSKHQPEYPFNIFMPIVSSID